MKNNKGQALVEFVLILPVLLIMIVGTIDLGNIIYKKYQLEGNLDEVVELYKQSSQTKLDNYANEKKLDIDIITESDMITIKLTNDIKISAPILGNIIDNPYEIEVERSIYNET